MAAGFARFAVDRNLKAWLARNDRALLQQGTDVATHKRQARAKAAETQTVQGLSQAWHERHIRGKYEHPEVVERVLRKHVRPVIGNLPLEEVRPFHVDQVLTRIVHAGAPTVANDAIRYPFRMSTSPSSGD